MFFPRAFMALLVPAVELFAFLRVADTFGGAVAVLALFGLSAVGYLLVRFTGGLALQSVATSLNQGSAPSSRDIADQAVRFIAAVLLVIPGFVSAAIGVLLFLPPIRALVRPRIETRAQSIIRPFSRSRRSAVDVDIVDVGGATAPSSPTSTPTKAQQQLR